LQAGERRGAGALRARGARGTGGREARDACFTGARPAVNRRRTARLRMEGRGDCGA
jgi:hypothetical protein